MLFAHCDPFLSRAVLAHDVAAPVEAAVAAVSPSLLDDVVTATAAQRAAAVYRRASAITLSSNRAREVDTGISLAEVRGTLVVEKVQC